MKTLKMIVAVVIASAAVGTAYAGHDGYTLAQAERVQAAPASQAEMPAPRPGWNKGSGSPYGVEWLTRTTKAHFEASSTNQPPASTAQSAGKNCNLKPMTGFNQHNSFEHSC